MVTLFPAVKSRVGPQTLVEIERTYVLSQVILTNKEELNFTGEEFKGDGFYGYADGSIQLVSRCPGFVGRIFCDANS